jgi:hypothetical protein
MRSHTVHAFMVAGVVTIALAGCAKTNLTNLWKNSEATSSLGNVMVVALERDDEMRRMWEDALTAEFQANGVMARPSYSLFPTSLPDSQQVVSVARRDKHDGVVVTHRLATAQTAKFDSDYAKTAPGGSNDYWRGWYHTHYMAANRATPAGNEDARFQIDVANVAGGGTLLWTGSTTPVDPADAEKLQKEVCGELVSELIRQDLMVPRK